MEGVLVSTENKKLGTTYFPEHSPDWQKEIIKKAKRNAGII